MRMRAKKSGPVKKATPRSKKPTRFGIGAQAIALGVIGVGVAAAMLLGTGPASQPSSAAATYAPQEKTAAAHARAVKPVAATVAPAAAAPEATAAAGAAPAKTAAAEPATKASEPNSSPVTITGCLELAHETFRLRDTSGVDAPKSRSWKSGFLKKASAPIEVVDTANRLQLPNHVGQRVSVTGTLVDRELQVRSLKRIAASCDVQVAKL